jgi:hypothetical protein
MTAFAVILGAILACLGLGSAFFRRCPLTRPAIGVMGLADVLFVLAVLVAAPVVSSSVPGWAATALLAGAFATLLHVVAEPFVRHRGVRWAIVSALVVCQIVLVLAGQSGSAAVPALNLVVLVGATVALANLWAQAGLKAWHATLLGVVLGAYDLHATVLTERTRVLVERVAELPLAPMLMWPTGSGFLSIGFADVLLATVFPLVMRRAFGRRAQGIALAANAALLTGMLLVVQAHDARAALPVMTVLGPVMLVQYVGWRRVAGTERTTWQYRHGDAADGGDWWRPVRGGPSGLGRRARARCESGPTRRAVPPRPARAR